MAFPRPFGYRSAMKSAVRLILLTYLLLLAIPTVADNPDFSGSYTLTGADRRADAQKATVVTITVVQTPTDVEITKLKDGQKMVNRVTLDGKSGVFNNLQGPFGTCQAHMKGKTLILEISGTVRTEKTDFKNVVSFYRSLAALVGLQVLDHSPRRCAPHSDRESPPALHGNIRTKLNWSGISGRIRRAILTY